MDSKSSSTPNIITQAKSFLYIKNLLKQHIDGMLKVNNFIFLHFYGLAEFLSLPNQIFNLIKFYKLKVMGSRSSSTTMIKSLDKASFNISNLVNLSLIIAINSSQTLLSSYASRAKISG